MSELVKETGEDEYHYVTIEYFALRNLFRLGVSVITLSNIVDRWAFEARLSGYEC